MSDCEQAWLIERYDDNEGRPMWYSGSERLGSAWTFDSLQAVRFARKEDAERVIAGKRWDGIDIVWRQNDGYGRRNVRYAHATEHIWDSGRTPSEHASDV